MAWLSFKHWWLRVIPGPLERSVYVACSGLLLILLVFFWQVIPGGFVWRLPLWFSTIALVGALGVFWVSFYFDTARLLGFRQAVELNKERVHDNFNIIGPYRVVRHPWMTATLLFLWGHAVMSPGLFLLCSGFTFYIFVGIWLEERDLQKQFGKPYGDYRKKVPALIPWSKPFPKGSYSPWIK